MEWFVSATPPNRSLINDDLVGGDEDTDDEEDEDFLDLIFESARRAEDEHQDHFQHEGEEDDNNRVPLQPEWRGRTGATSMSTEMYQQHANRVLAELERSRKEAEDRRP